MKDIDTCKTCGAPVADHGAAMQCPPEVKDIDEGGLTPKQVSDLLGEARVHISLLVGIASARAPDDALDEDATEFLAVAMAAEFVNVLDKAQKRLAARKAKP